MTEANANEQWGRYKHQDLTVSEFLSQQSVQVGPAAKDGETRAYRNAEFPEQLVNFLYKRPNCDTLHSLLEYQVENKPDSPYLGTRKFLPDGERGDYEFLSYKDVAERRKHLADGLKALGVEKYGTVGVFSKNRAEWVITEMACYCHSFTPVALYDTLGANAVSFVMNHAALAAIVCSGDHMVDIIKKAESNKSLKAIISMETELTDEQKAAAKAMSPELNVKVMSIGEVEALGMEEDNIAENDPSKVDDLATIMYTSGSTGDPKGVQLPHRAFLALTAGIFHHDVSPHIFKEESRHFSYLPLAHSFERVCCACILAGGGRIGFYTGDLKALIGDIGAFEPTFMVGAPRVFQRIFDRIQSKVNSGSFIKKMMFNLAYWWKESDIKASGHIADNSKVGWYDSIVFSKTKSLLGRNCKLILSGSAPLDPMVGRFLRAVLCVPVIQGYGLTENTAGAAVSYLCEEGAFSHCGPPLPSIEMKLVDVAEMSYTVKDKPFPRGEVLLRGPSVFTGYYKDPEKTSQDLEEDGWFHTGDIGQILDNGALQIIDRKKNIFKLSQGEYVAAEYLETVYARSPVAQQVFIYGDSLRNSLVAVVVPNDEAVREYAVQNKVIPDVDANTIDLKELYKHEAINSFVMGSMTEVGKAQGLKGFEFVRAIYLEDELFSVENDLMTPSFKQRRPQLKARYKDVIATLYESIP